jgi:hypothetical protein
LYFLKKQLPVFLPIKEILIEESTRQFIFRFTETIVGVAKLQCH